MSHRFRRLFPVICSFALALTLALMLALPPSAHAQGGPITYPPETEVVRGVIQIRGTAVHPEFWKYELAAAPFGAENWFNITASETQVQNDVLARWDTNTVPDGTYTLRLRIVKRDGNYDEYTVQLVLVANSAPAPTPTPTITPTPAGEPTATPTPPPPTATPVILTPDIPPPTTAPTATATPTPGAAAAAEEDGDELADLGGRIAAAFISGARLVLVAFLFVGLFFAIKNILNWLYYRFFAGN